MMSQMTSEIYDAVAKRFCLPTLKPEQGQGQ